MSLNVGKIDISKLKTPPEKHELEIAEFFAKLGKDVVFILPSNVKGMHTPDFYMDDIAWEAKTPRGKTTACISDNIRNAAKQSHYVVIDLRKISLPEQACVREIKSCLQRRRSLSKILVILKTKKLLTLSRKDIE